MLFLFSTLADSNLILFSGWQNTNIAVVLACWLKGQCNLVISQHISVHKKVDVRCTTASGFCCWTSGFYHFTFPTEVKVLAEFLLRKLIVLARIFQARENDFWASTSWLQLAQRASLKIEFLCTLHFHASFT